MSASVRDAAVAGVLLVISSSANAKPAPDKRALAQRVVDKYAYEAFPQWVMNHPERGCPSKLAELDEYMTASDRGAKDPWVHTYAMTCGDDMPAPAKGIAVYSLGPDGKAGTCDDVQSWDADHACK